MIRSITLIILLFPGWVFASPKPIPTPVDASHRALLQVRWRRPIVRMGFERSVNMSRGRPAIVATHNLVVVGTAEGDVRAYHSRDGQLQWQFKTKDVFEGAVSIVRTADATMVLAGSRDGTLYALRVRDGHLVWKRALQGEVRTRVQRIDAQHILVTTMNNQVMLLRSKDGATVWKQGRALPVGMTIAGRSEPLVHDGVVYASFSDGYVGAYRLKDGTKLWMRPLVVRHERFSDSDADPIMMNGRLFVTSYNRGVFALDPRDGSVLWSHRVNAAMRLAAAENTIIVGSGEGTLMGFNATTGKQRYRVNVGTGPVSRIEVSRGMALLTAGSRGVVAFNAHTGKPIQSLGLGDALRGGLAWQGNDVAVISPFGYLYMLSMRHWRGV